MLLQAKTYFSGERTRAFEKKTSVSALILSVQRPVLKFAVKVEKDEDGVYVASVPELPGCHTQAKTLDQLNKRIKEAIEAYLGTEGANPSRPTNLNSAIFNQNKLVLELSDQLVCLCGQKYAYF